MRGITILTGLVALVAVIGVAAFLHLTREITVPDQNMLASALGTEIPADPGNEVIFHIGQDESQVEYSIRTVLNGQTKLITGTTNQVTGDIHLKLSDLPDSTYSQISVDARTFETGDYHWDYTVARFILHSEEEANAFITFLPVSIRDLTNDTGADDSFHFQVCGSLTIAGVTQEVEFDVIASLIDDMQLTGQAETILRRSDFDLHIPAAPILASVEDEIVVRLVFVADAIQFL